MLRTDWVEDMLPSFIVKDQTKLHLYHPLLNITPRIDLEKPARLSYLPAAFTFDGKGIDTVANVVIPNLFALSKGWVFQQKSHKTSTLILWDQSKCIRDKQFSNVQWALFFYPKKKKRVLFIKQLYPIYLGLDA